MATALGFVAKRFAARVGPIGASVSYMLIANSGFLAICLSGPDLLDLPVWAVVVAILVRGAFMNAIGGMTGSVLNEHITSANRGKWAVVGQIGRCTWSGSAFVGGLLVDRIGYRQTLLVPLGCHVTAMLLLTPLMRMRRRAKG